MQEPIEEAYFIWLSSKVVSIDFPTPSLTFWRLLRKLHSIEFVWLMQGDDNRAQDGLDLRQEFLNQSRQSANQEWMNLGCSVLEMLIGFSRRAEFITDIAAFDWFWTLIDNLGLKELNDAAGEFNQAVEEAIDRFIWRTYQRNGSGGLFPLNNAERDQRKVEIWYQFSEYLIDQEL